MDQNTNSVPSAPVTTPAVPVKSAKAELTPFMDLLKQAVEIYRKLFKQVVTLSLLLFLAAAPIYLAIGASVLLFKINLPQAAAYLFAGLLMIAAVATTVYYGAAIQAGILCIIKNNSLNIREAFNQGRAFALRYIWVAVLTGLFVLLWGLLLIIPGIIFAVYYSFGQFAVVMEEKTGQEALRRSKELVKNYWWAVAGRIFLLGILYFVVIAVLSAPSGAAPEGSAFQAIWDFLINIVSMIVGPLMVIFNYLIFQDLKKIKEDASGGQNS